MRPFEAFGTLRHARRVRRPSPLRSAILILIALTLVQVGFGTQVSGAVDAALDAGVARDLALGTVGRLDYLHRDLAFVVLIGCDRSDPVAAIAPIAAGSLVFRGPGAGHRADRAGRGDGVWFAVTGRAGRASNPRQPVIGRGNGVVALEPEAERMRVRSPRRCRVLWRWRRSSRVRANPRRRRRRISRRTMRTRRRRPRPRRRARRCSATSARITARSRPRTPTRRSFSTKG